MSRFRKRPIEVDAWQIEPQWLDGHPPREIAREITINRGSRSVYVPTPEGLMRATVGSWIIRGVAGELYPCLDPIFRATYEPAAQAEEAA